MDHKWRLMSSRVMFLTALIQVRSEFSAVKSEAQMEFEKALHDKEEECRLKNLTKGIPDDGIWYCPIVWDGIACWPHVPAGQIWEMPCPGYITGFNTDELAYKECTKNGTWFFSKEHANYWTNYSQCYVNNKSGRAVFNFNGVYLQNSTIMREWLPIIRNISRVGYSVSLVTLVVAFIILATFKRLRCARNNLHMHLFASFIMRAVMTVLQESLNNADASEGEDQSMWPTGYSNTKWECKLLTSLWQYFIMANYSWVLMEGLYLHNLVFWAVFNDSSSILTYVILGWGLPLMFVVTWVALRATLDDILCWKVNTKPYLFWMIRGPITISIVLNFVFFINLSRVLLLKLRSSITPESRKFRKWAKSTLVLVPLFGVNYMIFMGMSLAMGVDEIIEVVWLVCDQTFASFQGFFVAILYCLLNGEVRGELMKKWYSYQVNHGRIPLNTSQFPQTGQSTVYQSRFRSSINENPNLNGHDRQSSIEERPKTRISCASVPEECARLMPESPLKLNSQVLADSESENSHTAPLLLQDTPSPIRHKPSCPRSTSLKEPSNRRQWVSVKNNGFSKSTDKESFL